MKRMIRHFLGALVLTSALELQLSPALAQGTNYTLLTTITNPTPAAYDNFGAFVTAVGNDRVLIGAPSDNTKGTIAGAAYLYTFNGVLLTSFYSPAPASYENFGSAVAAVGSDAVLIGTPYHYTVTTDAGAAYLFSTNGTCITTFTSPAPQYHATFGMTVAGVGSAAVLIGAPYHDAGAVDAGAAFLFSTNGAWITTFTNPVPNNGGQFGRSLAAVGTDRVLIAAPMNDLGAFEAGAVYLFSTNGTLLTTFTNPTPADNDSFGWPLTTVGTDLVLIGCGGDNTTLENTGAAYLFTTNAVLLRTFKSPSPAEYEAFGDSVAAVGTNRVLIGADGNSLGATFSGAAYLFSTNGTLLTTFTNPTPAARDFFGQYLTAVGTDRILISAWQDDTVATDSGVAYLYSLPPPPSLSICLTPTNTMAVSWPSPSTGWTLQENTNGLASANWSNSPGVIQDIGTNRVLIVDSPAGERYYRLIKPGG